MLLIARRRHSMSTTPEPEGSDSKLTERFEVRCDKDFLERLNRQAGRLKVKLAPYIRMAVLRQIEKDEETDPELK